MFKIAWKMFEYCIRHAKTDRYHLRCYIVARDKKQPSHEYEESSIGDRPITKNVTTEALEALGATLNFIDCWLKCFGGKYEVIFGMYNKAIKNIFWNIFFIALLYIPRLTSSFWSNILIKKIKKLR